MTATTSTIPTITTGWALPILRSHRFIEGGAVAFGDNGLGKCTCGEHLYATEWETHLAEKLEAAVNTREGDHEQ